MKFITLNEINTDIIKDYMSLTNSVIKKTHSIGFLEELNFDSCKNFLEQKILKSRSALILLYEHDILVGTGYISSSGYDTTKHYAEISKVMVNPNTQGKGYGKAIMIELENKAKELDYTHIMLDTWDVDYIVNFYKKCGYTQVGIIPEFVKYEGKYHDTYIFAKKLE